MAPPRDRAPCDTPSSTRPLACGCCRLAAFDAITRQQRPARGRVRSPPAVAGGGPPAPQRVGVLFHPGGADGDTQISPPPPRPPLVLPGPGGGCAPAAGRRG